MGLNFSLTFVYVSLLIFNFSQTQSIKVKTEESLPDMIKRYLAGVKTELLEQRSSVHRNTADNEKYNQPRITLPDGMNPEPAVGPGNPPRSVLQLTSKRSGNEQAYDLTCKAHEWFIFTDDMPACGKSKLRLSCPHVCFKSTNFLQHNQIFDVTIEKSDYYVKT